MSAIAKLIAGIGLNTDEFKRGIGEVKGQTSAVGEGFNKLKDIIAGAFSVGAVLKFVNSLKEYANTVKDAADSTGSTSEAIQALNAAAIEGAASAEKMKAGLEKIRTAQIDALDGNIQLREAFGRLGISMEQLEGVGADRVFELIGTAIVNADNETQALAAANDILGQRYVNQLLPTLKQVGNDGLDPLIAKYKDLGMVMDETMIAKIDLMGDKFEAFKTKILVGATAIAEFFERLGAGIGEWLSSASGTFASGWNQMALIQEENARKAVEAAKKANDGIRQAEEEKIEWVSDGIDYLAKIRAAEAKKAADIEIAEARRSAEEQKRLLNSLQSARDKYFRAFHDAQWHAMDDEQRRQALEQKRLGLISAIQTLEAENNSLSIEQQSELFILKTSLIQTEGELALAIKSTGKEYKGANVAGTGFTSDQVEGIKGLRTMLSDMTDKEITDLIEKIKLLHKEIGNLDFSGLQGLGVLRGFKIPNESVMNAGQFGDALSAMAKAMKGLTLPDLAPLEVLKGFSIPNESVLNARQFGKAIAELIKAISTTSLDLEPLQTLADLFQALDVGAVEINIKPPTKEELTLQMPSEMESTLSSINGHLGTLAGLKGVIFK